MEQQRCQVAEEISRRQLAEEQLEELKGCHHDYENKMKHLEQEAAYFKRIVKVFWEDLDQILPKLQELKNS